MNKRVFLFDVFGTVFDMSGIDRAEVADYVRTVKSDKWSPLTLPESWRGLRAWADAREGIQMLQGCDYYTHLVCSMTNCPVELLVHLSLCNDIQWDLIVPIELLRVYKPNSQAYMFACELLKVDTKDCVMVTANPTFGDVEAASALGMSVEIIKRPEYTVEDMARKYCE